MTAAALELELRRSDFPHPRPGGAQPTDHVFGAPPASIGRVRFAWSSIRADGKDESDARSMTDRLPAVGCASVIALFVVGFLVFVVGDMAIHELAPAIERGTRGLIEVGVTLVGVALAAGVGFAAAGAPKPPTCIYVGETGVARLTAENGRVTDTEVVAYDHVYAVMSSLVRSTTTHQLFGELASGTSHRFAFVDRQGRKLFEVDDVTSKDRTPFGPPALEAAFAAHREAALRNELAAGRGAVFPILAWPQADEAWKDTGRKITLQREGITLDDARGQSHTLRWQDVLSVGFDNGVLVVTQRRGDGPLQGAGTWRYEARTVGNLRVLLDLTASALAG